MLMQDYYYNCFGFPCLEYQAASSDLLGKMMLAKDEETGSTFSDQELRDQVMSLLIAGHEVLDELQSHISNIEKLI